MSDPNQEFQPPPPPTIEAPPERRRPANMLIIGIVLFVLGIAILIAGVAKIVVGGLGTGAAVACLGVLLFALSFVRLPEVGPHAPPPLGVFDRLAGIFYEPTRVFGNLRVYPRWVAGILVIAILNVAYIIRHVKNGDHQYAGHPSRINPQISEDPGWFIKDSREPVEHAERRRRVGTNFRQPNETKRKKQHA